VRSNLLTFDSPTPSRGDSKFLAKITRIFRIAVDGRNGILLVCWRCTRAPDVSNRLFQLIENNAEQATDELMWGHRALRSLHRLCGRRAAKNVGVSHS